MENKNLQFSLIDGIREDLRRLKMKIKEAKENGKFKNLKSAITIVLIPLLFFVGAQIAFAVLQNNSENTKISGIFKTMSPIFHKKVTKEKDKVAKAYLAAVAWTGRKGLLADYACFKGSKGDLQVMAACVNGILSGGVKNSYLKFMYLDYGKF